MIDSNFIKNTKINLPNVSRETLKELDDYGISIISKNKDINLISSSTEKSINTRHIADSAQTIDFIDNIEVNTCTDLGSGAGLPGIVLSILMKHKKPQFKMIFYEKSFHKSKFLIDMSKKFNLNTEVHQKNIFGEKNLNTDVIISRAFKPLPIIFEIADRNFKNFKFIILFLGKGGKKILNESFKFWKFDYEEKKSLTNTESTLIKISNLKKKMYKKIISIINQKGGVGKTTTVINLAAGLSMKGKKILVIDLDPQGNATTGLGLSNTASSETTIYSVLNGNKKISEVIQRTSFENLNLITSNVDLSGLEVETAGDSRRAFKLKDELTAILNDSRASYDYILIDCPPSLSLLTIMALVASDALVVPLQTEFFALEGLTQLMKTIERIKNNLNPELSIRGILLTMYDRRNRLSGEVEKEARNYFKEKVYRSVVPRNVRLSEAPSHGVPVLIYDKSCPGSKSYFNFTEEFLNQDKTVESAA